MRLAPEVERRKVAQEVATLERNAADLRARGAILLDATTTIDVLVVPSGPVRFLLPLAAPVPFGQPGRPVQVLGNVMSMAARSFALRFDLSGFDQRAPSVEFRHPRTMASLSFQELPTLHEATPTGVQAIVVDAHPDTKRPFLCVKGVREYHQHPQHDGDAWCLYRGSINVYAILDRVLRAVDQSQPCVMVADVSWQAGLP